LVIYKNNILIISDIESSCVANGSFMILITVSMSSGLMVRVLLLSIAILSMSPTGGKNAFHKLLQYWLLQGADWKKI
jgi:hypothetical protein